MSWKFPTYTIDEPIQWDELELKFDWLAEMRTVPQDPIWHAEGNVFIHTKMVVEELIKLEAFSQLDETEKHILFAAALLHDVEKRSTTEKEMIDGVERISSPRHAMKGEYTARTILYKDIPTPFKIKEQIAKLVRYHGLPIWAITKDDPRKSVIEASLVVDTKLLYILSKADIKGRISKSVEDSLLNLELFKALCLEHGCFGQPRFFPSNYGRFLYLSRKEIAPDYEPFYDLKFKVTVFSALPGTGKDTYIKKHFNAPILSLDDIRRAHKISPTDKKKNGQVIQLAKEQAKSWMRAKQSFVFNATNITFDMRRKWISLFLEYGAFVDLIYLEVPYKVLLKQNRNRANKVPENVIEKLIRRLEIPTYREAHEVTFVTDESLGKRNKRNSETVKHT